MQNLKLIIIEDEPLVGYFISRISQKLGFEVIDILDGSEGTLEQILSTKPDMLIVDIRIAGGKNGIDLATEIYDSLGTPSIFITANSDIESIKKASEIYPYGYLIKPVDEPDVIAALVTAKNRLKKDSSVLSDDTTYYIDENICYYPSKYEISSDGEAYVLTLKESKLLELLLANRGQVVNFDKMDSYVWDNEPTSDGTRRTLVHRLNKRIGKKIIKTVSSIGYILD